MKLPSLFTVFLAAGAYAMPTATEVYSQPSLSPAKSHILTTTQASEAGLEKRTGPGIVAAADKMKGKPYVWGGGNIHGPTNGGFDCSGLTQYSVYQAEKKGIRAWPWSSRPLLPKLRANVDRIRPARTAQAQYASKLGKHIPRAQAKAGDLLFWGKGGDCKTGVVHVGIFTKPGWMVNAAHTGVPVREQKIWTSYGGESICPDAVRFW